MQLPPSLRLKTHVTFAFSGKSSGATAMEGERGGGGGLRHLLQNYYYENESRLYAEADNHKNCTQYNTLNENCTEQVQTNTEPRTALNQVQTNTEQNELNQVQTNTELRTALNQVQKH
ncbi:hypothetical protein WMY93_017937 [Mugilogobius chulae]|uniref:Uncharacterized protein n=1 Tax=Mugilogobius chulae TaxID=88201 RepID=A0AAW0NIQ9_9GOBI